MILYSTCKKTACVNKKISRTRLVQIKKAEFTFVNEHFFIKHNAVIGVFLQTLYKKILFLILLSLPLFSFSQSIGRYSFSSATGFYNKNVYIDFSVGQTIVKAFKNNKILTSGFQQPLNLKSSIKNENQIIDKNFSITVFPNPVTNFVNIYITSKSKIQEISVKIFSIDGKEIHRSPKFYNNENFSQVQLDLSKLNRGNYILKIYTNNLFSNSFTIIKL